MSGDGGSAGTELSAAQIERYFTDFDFELDQFASNYSEIVSSLHDKCPVASSPDGYYMLVDYETVRAGARMPELSHAKGVVNNRPDGFLLRYPLECDDPLHRELRSPLNPHFSPASVKRFEQPLQEMADALLDSWKGGSPWDAVSDYARPLSGQIVFQELLLLPSDQVGKMGKLVHEMVSGPKAGKEEAAALFYASVDEALTYHIDRGTSDAVVGEIVNMRVDGRDAEYSVKLGLFTSLVIGGLETTAGVLAQALYFLASHPEERERLVAAPELMPEAVEEFLRLYASAWALGRTVTEDVELGGKQFREGDFVYLGWGPASRDPRVFPNPDDFDPDRKDKRHLAFGSGQHRCVGSHLARLMLRVGLRAVLSLHPQFSVPDGFVPQYSASITRGIEYLPLLTHEGVER